MKTVLYCRVSTVEQTLEHQRTQAEAAGFKIDEVIADHGVSGVTTRLAERPQGRRLFDILRRGDTLAVRWIDRLGRDYEDVSDTIREMMKRGVVVRTVIHGMVFDGSVTDPMSQAVRDALIGFMAALSQAQAEATKEAQRAGIEHAKAKGGVYRGRKPSYTRREFEIARSLLDQEVGYREGSQRDWSLRQTVYRISARRGCRRGDLDYLGDVRASTRPVAIVHDGGSDGASKTKSADCTSTRGQGPRHESRGSQDVRDRRPSRNEPSKRLQVSGTVAG